MKKVYAGEDIPTTIHQSLFLAGPSPRRKGDPDWRSEACRILEDLGYEGHVFIPLPREGDWPSNYQSQTEWETLFLNIADQVLFWVPRDFTVHKDVNAGDSAEGALLFPGMTTNVEFGLWAGSGKVLLGFPEGAPKTRYLAFHAEREGVETFHTLEALLRSGMARVTPGAFRVGGEVSVPLLVWNLQHFQAWYQPQVAAGNRLESSEVLWNFRVGPARKFVFAFALRVSVWVASENRLKSNEFILARPDIATVVAFHPAPRIADTEIVLIREFRSPASLGDCFIRECPGGSSWKPGDNPKQTMLHELEEETGLGQNSGFSIDLDRVTYLGVRQVAATLSTHKAHVFAIRINSEEMAYLRSQEGVPHGVASDTERTYVEVHRLGNLLAEEITDWATLGMVLTHITRRVWFP